MKGRYSYYDPKEDVVFTDISGIEADAAMVDLVVDEMIRVARSAMHKPFVLVCWRGAKMDAAAVAQYARRVADLLVHVRAIVRYETTDPLARSVIRTTTMTRGAPGARSNLFATREEALAAIRRGEIKEEPE